ncbi:hypothetical protein GCM10011519_22430 [Marmoricola endophyticus]|uniref:DAGKc domain-containing protein n=1 Tax=Marmoricola endophyticus TaxID=2040280 RepID=A0A917F3X8_9ACTN|nr:phosphatase PAP2 family protein [Marmoricola endophyticus]GGF47938.1 hypothetical protein GCM10011519_22430 [Marmoricola endophyticus]
MTEPPGSATAPVSESVQRRRTSLLWGSTAAVGFALVWLVVGLGWSPVLELDRATGQWPQETTAQHEWLRHLTLGVSYAFDLIPMTLYTIVTAVLLYMRNHVRAAAWTVIVMLTTSVLTTVVKQVVRRDRPEWDEPLHRLSSYSFPSGHASAIAAAASVAAVLAWMLVRRRNLRRLVVAVAVAVAVVVAADRVFLGVHHLSDVVAGWLLGVAVASFAVALLDPIPRPSAPRVEAMPAVFPSSRQLAVVLNPAKVDDPDAFRAMVEAMAAEAGWEQTTWYETTVQDPGVSQAHAAAVGGADLVITCGGDGTVRTVCEELAGTGIPIGIVPAGTGNLLARNLELPLYLRAAVDVALTGQDRAIDMVSVSGDAMEDSTFLVMAGMGFDAAIMEGVNEDIKSKVGWLAYVLSALKSLMFPAVRVEISVDGAEPTKHRARTIVIGNVGSLQAGMPLIPDAEIDDGELDVVLLNPRRFLSWLPLAVRVLSRNKRTDETITRMRGRTVRVVASGDSPRQLDGDLIEPGKELYAECIPGRLLVRVPRDKERSRLRQRVTGGA